MYYPVIEGIPLQVITFTSKSTLYAAMMDGSTEVDLVRLPTFFAGERTHRRARVT